MKLCDFGYDGDTGLISIKMVILAFWHGRSNVTCILISKYTRNSRKQPPKMERLGGWFQQVVLYEN